MNAPSPDGPVDRADRPLVLLVHGTWGRESAWAKPGSPMWETLSEAGFEVDRLAWSGHNSHLARIRATRLLSQEIAARTTATRSVHGIVAHSHGGNIAVHAVWRLRPPGAPPIRVVTIATPFILARERFEGWRTYLFGIVLLIILAIQAGAVTAWSLDWHHVRQESLSAPAASALAIAFAMLPFSVVAVLGPLHWLGWIHRHEAPTRDGDKRYGVLSRQGRRHFVAAVNTPPIHGDDLLVFRAPGDEASMSLVGGQLLGSLSSVAALLVKAVLTTVGLAIGVQAVLPGLDAHLGGAGDWLAFGAVVLLAAGALMTFLGVVVSSGVFGYDGVVGSIVARATTESTPPGVVRVVQRGIPGRRRGLLHSWLTSDAETICRVVHFMQSDPRAYEPCPADGAKPREAATGRHEGGIS